MDYITEIISFCPLRDWQAIFDAFFVDREIVEEIVSRFTQPDKFGPLKIILFDMQYVLLYKTKVVDSNNTHPPLIHKYIHYFISDVPSSIEVRSYVHDKVTKKMLILPKLILANSIEKDDNDRLEFYQDKGVICDLESFEAAWKIKVRDTFCRIESWGKYYDMSKWLYKRTDTGHVDFEVTNSAGNVLRFRSHVVSDNEKFNMKHYLADAKNERIVLGMNNNRVRLNCKYHKTIIIDPTQEES